MHSPYWSISYDHNPCTVTLKVMTLTSLSIWECETILASSAISALSVSSVSLVVSGCLATSAYRHLGDIAVNAEGIEDAEDIKNAKIAVNAEDIEDAEIVSISQILDMYETVQNSYQYFA